MAKYEVRFKGDLENFLSYIQKEILRNSSSASLEESFRVEHNGIKTVVQAYERYSYLGGNRLTLTLALVGNGDQLDLSLMTTGGSQAVFFKINTWGEENFLSNVQESVEQYIKKRG